MLRAELKRILKTRSTWWLAGIALALCLALAYQTVHAVFCLTYDENGQQIVKGVRAYELNREKYALLEGEITPELVAEAVRAYQDSGNPYTPELNPGLVGRYAPVYNWIAAAFTDETGDSLPLAELTPERALNFYQEWQATLERQLEMQYAEQPQVVEYALSRVRTGERFQYSYGIGSTLLFDKLGTCAFLVTLLCTVMAAPVFASDYASGADHILRCTRRGRRQLALAKLGAAMLTALGVFLLCVGAYLAVMNLAFGLDDRTSAELWHVRWNVNGWTVMECFWVLLLLSLLTFLAMTCFTLFLSSRLGSPMAVLAVSFGVAIAPTVLLLSGADGNGWNWLRFCLPSGGLLPVGAMEAELGGLRFLWLGGLVAWSPNVMAAASAVQIPVWLLLSVGSYCRRQA